MPQPKGESLGVAFFVYEEGVSHSFNCLDYPCLIFIIHVWG